MAKISITHEGPFEVTKRPTMSIRIYPSKELYDENEPAIAALHPFPLKAVMAVVIIKGGDLAARPMFPSKDDVIRLDGMVPSVGALEDKEGS